MKKGTKRASSVSQIIRDYAEKNPGLGPTQIAKDLTAQGHNAYPALVSQAIGKTGKKKGKRKLTSKRGRKPGTAKASQGADLNLLSLKAASDLIKASGSADDAIASIRTYQKLSAMFQ